MFHYSLKSILVALSVLALLLSACAGVVTDEPEPITILHSDKVEVRSDLIVEYTIYSDGVIEMSKNQVENNGRSLDYMGEGSACNLFGIAFGNVVDCAEAYGVRVETYSSEDGKITYKVTKP